VTISSCAAPGSTAMVTWAVSIYGHGRSVVEDNDLTGNMEGAWVIEEDAGADVTRAHQGITYGLFRAPVFRHAGFRFFLLRGAGSFPRRSPVPRVLSTVPHSRALMAPDKRASLSGKFGQPWPGDRPWSVSGWHGLRWRQRGTARSV